MKKALLYLRQFPKLFAVKFIIFGIFKRFFNPDGIVFYSQMGEDQTIQTLLCEKISKGGFYVDIGCNHPVRFSNTFGLYCNGWRGICVDANLDLVNEFKKIRKKDWVLHAAVSDEEKDVNFYVSTLDLASTMDISFVNNEWAKENYELKEMKKMRTVTLNTILGNFSQGEHKHLLDRIDLLSIDAEGHDFNVLRSIDLEKYRPSLIVIEMHEFDKEHPLDNEICQYLALHHYRLAGYHIMNGFFLSLEF
jgi:FkbM family methyltransferase